MRESFVFYRSFFEAIKNLDDKKRLKMYDLILNFALNDEEIETTPMYKGDMPKAVIPKSFASPSLLASILDKKYNFSLPLYRQEKALERIGITLSRQTMSNWIMKLYDLYFQEFVEYMHDQLLKCEYINADETKLEVLELKKSEGIQDCYMWVYKTGRSEEKKMDESLLDEAIKNIIKIDLNEENLDNDLL